VGPLLAHGNIGTSEAIRESSENILFGCSDRYLIDGRDTQTTVNISTGQVSHDARR